MGTQEVWYFVKKIITLLHGKKRIFYGDEKESEYFWGDYAKANIKNIRNRVFNGINTLKYDPKMPFIEKNKKYANYWFSSSDGHTVQEFNDLLSKSNIDKLRKEGGLCIVYTHFASGFVDINGELDQTLKANLEYLSKQNGWFVPASTVLDYLLKQKNNDFVNSWYINQLDLKWLFDRIIKRVKYKR